jgi:carboxyl-terminal processing protease
LQDYGRALLVGDRSTHGKGTVQSLSQLKPYLQMAGMDTTNEPGALKFTIRKFYRASGASTQFKGVTPDIILPSVLNESKTIGEESLDYALPWDTIPCTDFDKVDRVAPYLGELKKLSDARIARDKDFDYIREDIAQFVKRENDKTISLDEKERRQEKDEEDARRKARNEERLARKGPEPVIYEISLKQAELPGLPAPMELTNGLAKASSATAAHAAAGVSVSSSDVDSDDEPKAPDVDPMLNETESILVDYLRLLNKGVIPEVAPVAQNARPAATPVPDATVRGNAEMP